MAASEVRVTVIAADGRVLADSQSDTRTMENHLDRPEVREALARGEGTSARRGVTVGRDLVHYAVKYDLASGTAIVLRFALPLATVHETLMAFRSKLWFASVIIMLLAGTASLLVSLGFSDRIERLKEFSRRVAEGDFRPLPVDGSGDALEKLGASLNQTAARLDQTIRTLERVRRDFVANFPQKSRTPLTAIQGFAETLLAGAMNDPQNRERFLEIIVEHSRRLARLTEDLLMLSKMDADRLELEIRRVSVAQLIESCMETSRHRAAEKEIEISVKPFTGLPA